MKLSSDNRLQIETFAKEAAMRHFHEQHPEAGPAEAIRFAVRSWRSPEFIKIGVEIHVASDRRGRGRAV